MLKRILIILIIFFYMPVAQSGESEYQALLDVYHELLILNDDLQSRTLLVGEKGDQGEQGSQGEQGNEGPAGSGGSEAIDAAVAADLNAINDILTDGEVWVDDLSNRMSTLLFRTNSVDDLVDALNTDAELLEGGNN